MASSMPTLTELQPPDSEEALRRTFAGYQQALAKMTVPDLLAHLTSISAQLETQRQTILRTTLGADSGGLSGYLESLDRLSLRSTPTDPRSLLPRGRAGQASPTSRPPSALERLSTSARLGPRLAAKLVAASARASSRDR